jgi:endonuclease/exonuclease/phosphatase family metal-dependent hydrolase
VSVAGTRTRVAVGTFNIHHGVGVAERLDCARTADVIAGLDVDVVGLQEVDRRWSRRSAFADQAGYLARRLGMRMAFGATLNAAGQQGRRRQYGVALLSRHPVLRTRNTLLPCPRGGEQRTLLEARVDVRGVVLRCLVTHLQHRSPTERRAQAAAIDTAAGDSDAPTVLLGDLNAEPGTAEITTLTRHLADTWAGGGEGEGCTFPATVPRIRIDYVLASPDIEVERARVVGTDASDHLPVTAGLRLPDAAHHGPHDGDRPRPSPGSAG